MEIKDIETAIEGILFAAGESVSASRLAEALELPLDTVHKALDNLKDYYAFERRGIRLIKLEDSYQLVSSPDCADYIRKALEMRKPPKLSQIAIEVLSIIAYYQPTTRTYVERLRGIDSSYTISLLCDRSLIEECGRLDVPGRPLLYRTTESFLKTFGLSSLEELPELPGNFEQLVLEGMD